MIPASRIFSGFSRCHFHYMQEKIIVNKYQQCLTKSHPRHLIRAQTLTNAHHLEDLKNNLETIERGKSQFRKLQTKTNSSPEKELDFSADDPDIFGNLTRKTKFPVEPLVDDEGDVREEQFIENRPHESQKLSIKEYATLIKDFFKEKKVAKAIDVLETRMLKDDRVKPDSYIYNLIIGECGRLGYTVKAFQLYNQMKKRALKVSGSTYTGLFNACANSPWPKDGLKRANHLRNLMIEKGYEPNADNYHAMIKAFGRHGDISTAFTLVDEMAEQKIVISNETFNFLFQACITDKEAGFRHALLLWRKMIQKKIKPDLYTFNLLLRSIRDCGLGDLDVAHDVFYKITGGSYQQDVQNTKETPLLSDDTQVALNPSEINPETLENGSPTIMSPSVFENRPNLLALHPHLGNIIALSEITKPEDRLILVGGCSGFLEQMKKHRVKQNIKTFTLLLDVIPTTKAAEQAMLQSMEKAGVRPDIDFYNMLIKKRSLRFDYKQGHDVLLMIKRAKLHPDIVTFGVLALGCETQDEAFSLIEDMSNSGYRMNTEILGAMLKQGCSRFNFEYILAIMNLAIQEQIRPNEIFLDHLDKFHEKGWQKIKNKDVEGNSKESNRKFKISFKKFCSYYNKWLSQISPDKLGHPWEQFQNKKETDETPKDNDISRKINKMRKIKHFNFMNNS